MILGCAIYYLFTSGIKGKMNVKTTMFREFINYDMPIIINKTLFGNQPLNERTDELIFGIYSIYEMGEFVSSSLKGLRISMNKMLKAIADLAYRKDSVAGSEFLFQS